MTVFLTVLLVLALLVFPVGYICERRLWNKGKCICGSKWESFDVDSQGCRGYKCRKCDRTIWISHPFID